MSGVDSPLVRWLKVSEIGHITEKKKDEPWEPYIFHTDPQHDLRPFTKYELAASPCFLTWNKIYIRLYYDGELDDSFGSNKPQFIDLLEDRISFERVNFSKVVPSEYLNRLVTQFDESPLSANLERWWELPGVIERPTTSS